MNNLKDAERISCFAAMHHNLVMYIMCFLGLDKSVKPQSNHVFLSICATRPNFEWVMLTYKMYAQRTYPVWLCSTKQTASRLPYSSCRVHVDYWQIRKCAVRHAVAVKMSCIVFHSKSRVACLLRAPSRLMRKFLKVWPMTNLNICLDSACSCHVITNPVDFRSDCSRENQGTLPLARDLFLHQGQCWSNGP